MQMAMSIVTNEISTMLARALMQKSILDPEERDINKECGYPSTIPIEKYKEMYLREGMGKRVVSLHSDESWIYDPVISESGTPTIDTKFEKEFVEFEEESNLFYYAQKIDEISGIGNYGLLLYGINDGKPLSSKVRGFRADGSFDFSKRPEDTELLYIRALDHSLCSIASIEKNPNNPRFGQPTMYEVQLLDIGEAVDKLSSATAELFEQKTVKVHWTRVQHVADNTLSNEFLGIPRQKPVYNRLLDIRKILSGSGEMFWQGAFPGLSIEPPTGAVGEVEIGPDERDSIREEVELYVNKMRRYLAFENLQAKTLAPNIVTPTGHMAEQLLNIAITLSCPMRILIGGEIGRLASGQDIKSWNKRMSKRQKKYVWPRLLLPMINRLIRYGILPVPENRLKSYWPDLNAPTDEDRADIANKKSTALMNYVAGDIESIIPLLDYLTVILGMQPEQAEDLLARLKSRTERFTEKPSDLQAQEFNSRTNRTTDA